jgi:P-type Cu+ transporter
MDSHHAHAHHSPGAATDPVCGMTVDPRKAKWSTEVDGHTYYFCNPRCLEKFRNDPAKYLAPDAANAELHGAEHAAAAAAEYVCPMHPEVVRDRPGACPICGMALEPRTVTADDEPNHELSDMTRRFWVCLIATLPVFVLGMSDMIPGAPIVHSLGPRTLVWAQFALATPVVVWGGWPFFERAWASILNRSLNMFTLIALGTSVAYLYSVFVALFPHAVPAAGGHGAVYFEAAAVITTLVLLGQVLELRARSQTSSAIRALLRLAPKTARRLRADGSEEDLPIEQIRVGDRLRVRPGERVPIDGVVLEGRSSVDESMITGEPVAVEKTSEMQVTGGTINGTGGFVMRAERVGADTLLSRIVRMVSEAQRTRAPIQRLADRVSGWFVPAVIVIAVATFIAWSLLGPEPRLAHALVNAVAVLIIACPCALGLATPISIMVGTGRGARAGVLIKQADALETLAKVDTIVVDKTGTLTEGKPRLVSVQPALGVDERELLRIAAGLERASEHPLSSAILGGAQERGVEPAAVREFRSVTGEGVAGTLDGVLVAVGNAKLMAAGGGDPSRVDARAEELRKLGQTVVFVARGSQLIGLLGIADPIKQSARDAIAALHAEGLRVVMLSGDNAITADAVASALGIDEVYADVSPEQKGDAIRRLQAEGRTVAMAGDGINDAPALASAHVGIAMGTGTDVAMQSAGVTLVSGDLRGIVRARRLSRATVRNIRQNLFFAFFYNALSVPIAAGLLYPLTGWLLSPMLASAAMSVSSVSVIANALRLRRLEL